MARIRTDDWVVVANSEKALFLVNEGDAEHPHLTVFRKKTQDNPPTREQAANRRGRFNDGPSAHRSAVDDTDWHELAKERFADDLADILYKKAHAGAFERIILVADPSVLGNLRPALHSTVEEKIVGEIAKNLAGHPIDEIEEMVKSELAD